jgi:hypothetical protein
MCKKQLDFLTYNYFCSFNDLNVELKSQKFILWFDGKLLLSFKIHCQLAPGVDSLLS